ncbi:MAG: PCRF domain-containing protein, partial [Chloroflexota bacterium]
MPKPSDCWSVFDIPNKEKRLAELEALASSPDFWNNPDAARAAMRELSELREPDSQWETLTRRLADARELAELDDESLRADLEPEVEAIVTEVHRLDFESIFTDKHDHGNAILAIHAGAGGVDSMDFASMLLRMYLRWADSHGYKTDIIDQTDGEEAGIKSVTVTMTGRQAYGY